MTNGFKLIGISTRTTNKNNQAKTDIEKLWNRFYAEAIVEKIPHQTSDNIIAIYTDYQSNYTEEYTAIVGVLVTSLEEIPNGLIGREFKAENFQKFTAKGKMPEAVVKTWTDIWQRDNELNRKYTYDFEVYGSKAQQGETSEVELYIAVQ